MDKIKEKYIFPPFFIDPQYRIWRYLLFIIAGFIITSSMVFVAYQDCADLLGDRIYLLCFSTTLLYAGVILFNYYYLVPNILLKGRYVAYSLILFGFVFLLPTLSVLQEYWVRTAFSLPHRITSYTNPLILIDNLSSSMLIIVCFLGTSVVVLLRRWIERKSDIDQMEYEHIDSEINKLKGQITPAFLSRALTNASSMVKTNPQKATGILMQLGQLLRYQLYDCNRDKVLLRSEINFLNIFLSTEQLNRDGFEYDIQVEGDLNNVFVSPLLFISLIQDLIMESAFVSLCFSLKENLLVFRLKSDSKKQLPDEDAYIIKRRMNLLYPDNYILLLQNGMTELKINILK